MEVIAGFLDEARYAARLLANIEQGGERDTDNAARVCSELVSRGKLVVSSYWVLGVNDSSILDD